MVVGCPCLGVRASFFLLFYLCADFGIAVPSWVGASIATQTARGLRERPLPGAVERQVATCQAELRPAGPCTAGEPHVCQGEGNGRGSFPGAAPHGTPSPWNQHDLLPNELRAKCGFPKVPKPPSRKPAIATTMVCFHRAHTPHEPLFPNPWGTLHWSDLLCAFTLEPLPHLSCPHTYTSHVLTRTTWANGRTPCARSATGGAPPRGFCSQQPRLSGAWM